MKLFTLRDHRAQERRADVGQKRCAQLMKISSWKVNTEIQQHIEVAPAFSAGNIWRYAEIFGTKRVRSGWGGKSDSGRHNIVPIFFVSAKKTILDQKKGPVAPT